MTDARLIPDAVQWHEGMLLSPQHFQQADLRNQALQGYMTLLAAPYGWGVIRLRINEAALMAGRFAVTDLEAVMPDGLLVQHADAAEANAPILQLDLRPVLADPSSPRRIAGVSCISRPTRQVAPPRTGGTLWRLVSHLSVNHLSMTDAQDNAAVLREILLLYCPTDDATIPRRITGLKHLATRRVVRHIGADAWRGFCRGTEITLECQAAQHLDGNRLGRFGDADHLESPRQGGIFLDEALVFAGCRGGNHAQAAARQRRLQQVRGIALAGRPAGADEHVGFVDEQTFRAC
jgi:hypothetical protein